LRGVMRFGGINTDCCSYAVLAELLLVAGRSGASIICSGSIVDINIFAD